MADGDVVPMSGDGGEHPPRVTEMHRMMLHGAPDLSEAEARRRDLKHELTESMRRLVEDAAMVDASECDEAELAELVGEVRRLSARFEALPSHRRYGGLNEAVGWEGALTERSPVSGRGNPLAAPLELWSDDGETTRGRAIYGGAHEGPPGSLHGGLVAGAFDELLGVAQSASGSAGFTGTLTVRFRRPTPLYTAVEYEAGVDRLEGRKILASGVSRARGEVVGEAEAVFIIPRDLLADDPRAVGR